MTADAEMTMLTMPSDTELLLVRVFDAPRELVWKAWTDPAHLPRWWGPTGFTTTSRSLEVRPGGQWRFVMHGPDGRDYENLITFTEVVEPERLGYRHGGDLDLEPVNFRVLVTLERAGAAGAATKLSMRSTFASKAARDFVLREYNAGEGGKQHLARLADYVAHLGASDAEASAGRPFTIQRVFDAPRDLVWRVWTDREHLARWFGPRGVTIPQCTLDLRVGGAFHYCMRMANGVEHWGRWIFRDLAAPKRLVFVSSFADSAGNAIKPPFEQDWPVEMLATVTFEEHAGKSLGTVVTVRSEAFHATESERRTFDSSHDSMRQGWTGTFDQLATCLAASALHAARPDRS